MVPLIISILSHAEAREWRGIGPTEQTDNGQSVKLPGAIVPQDNRHSWSLFRKHWHSSIEFFLELVTLVQVWACTPEIRRRYREIPAVAHGIMPGISNRTMARVESWQMTLRRYTRKRNPRPITLNWYASAWNSRLVQSECMRSFRIYIIWIKKNREALWFYWYWPVYFDSIST